ncbi:MAG: hypothetical protein KDE15_11165 [Erythrobacter sp.]|nr:hypothetical protein [Erythrobacter sp.]
MNAPLKALATLIALGLTATAMPAFAAQQHDRAPTAQVVDRDAHGRATVVRVDGRDYAVCRQGREDECINPREAGLNFGNVPIDYWPGQPASQIDHPLPQHQPARN